MDVIDAGTRTVDALKSRSVSLGVWGCGHIGASAMYHFSRHGVRCVGYDIAASRVQEIRDGRFLTTDVVPTGRVREQNPNVTATTDWHEMVANNVAVHLIAVPTERGAEPSSAALEDVMPLICEAIRLEHCGRAGARRHYRKYDPADLDRHGGATEAPGVRVATRR